MTLVKIPDNTKRQTEFPTESPHPQHATSLSHSRQAASATVVTLPDHQPLHARLKLRFAAVDKVTRLVEREHIGPLLVQKPLYPEGSEICHTVIIHPPGGIVSGDQMEINTRIGPEAKVQITTPGATKWYKSKGYTARQKVSIHIDSSGALEWLPQETIFFNHADVGIDHEVNLQGNAIYVGCEILCFGRTASGETFNNGQIRQRTRIRRDDKLIWLEQIRLQGQSFAMKGPLSLAGNTVCATLIMTGRAIIPARIDEVREAIKAIELSNGHIGLSQMKSVIVARYLGQSSEAARQAMLQVWSLLRPEFMGCAATTPRMWNT